MNLNEESGDQARTVVKANESGMLINILFNIVVPSLVLSKFSGPERLGPVMAFWLALAFPLLLGVWEFVRNRQTSFFSVFGLLNVALTGGLGFLALDGFWFAVKEGAFPGLLGIGVLVSMKMKTSLVQTLLINDRVVNLRLVREKIALFNRHDEFETLMRRATLLFSLSFFLSAGLNFGLARYILRSAPGTSEFNAELGKMTALSFPVIALPVLVFTGFVLWYLVSGLTRLTALSKEELLVK
ncbi:MAG: hypothetical protein RI953_1497 [Pseudomonadota bacterium]|jgi:hypothetical protein